MTLILAKAAALFLVVFLGFHTLGPRISSIPNEVKIILFGIATATFIYLQWLM